jgi:hypothetical protein
MLDKYLCSARQFVAFLEARGMPATTGGLAREHVEAWIAELLETRAPATAMSRYQALRQWFAWLVEEAEMAEPGAHGGDRLPVPVAQSEVGSGAAGAFDEQRHCVTAVFALQRHGWDPARRPRR